VIADAFKAFAGAAVEFLKDPWGNTRKKAAAIGKKTADDIKKDADDLRNGKISRIDAAKNAVKRTLVPAAKILTPWGAVETVVDGGNNIASGVDKIGKGDIDGGVRDITTGILQIGSVVAPGGKVFKAVPKIPVKTIANDVRATGRPALGSCLNSFTPDTLVLMAGGGAIAIQDIRVGDMVIATDPQTGVTTEQPVLAVHINGDTELTDLTVVDHDGNIAVIHTTPHHPFWDDSRKKWVDASALDVGHRLRTTDGRVVRAVAVLSFTSPKDMYNLTVEATHTYYVLASAMPVLVHNQGGLCPVSGKPHGGLGEAASYDRLTADGYTKITKGVAFENSNGDMFIADFVARDPSGVWWAIDAKTGARAKLTPNQELGYAELNGTGARLRSDKLDQYRMPNGAWVRMNVEIDEWTCPQCSP
jgi:hypothetical protein